MNKTIVADTSFYLCYQNDIKKREYLDVFLKSYSFYIGKCVLNELPPDLSENELFLSTVNYNDNRFFELVKPYFGRTSNHKNDGEYESIGLAYHLKNTKGLKYLIIDDKRAYKFVISNFPYLKNELIRNIGFIKNCCKIDLTISMDMAIDILESIKKTVEAMLVEGNTCRPCSVDVKLYRNILIPLIKELSEENG